jgi:hypothetical protein
MAAPSDWHGRAASADQQVSFCPQAPEVWALRIIGLDIIHRAFAEAVVWKDGKLGRVGSCHYAL